MCRALFDFAQNGGQMHLTVRPPPQSVKSALVDYVPLGTAREYKPTVRRNLSKQGSIMSTASANVALSGDT